MGDADADTDARVSARAAGLVCGLFGKPRRQALRQRQRSSRTWRLAIKSFGRWTDERITQLMQLQ
jgi:hypothetical protein